MPRLSQLIKHLKALHPLSKVAGLIGATLMAMFYIIAALALHAAPTAEDYFYAMSVYRGALEAAPACLAVGIAAGLLGDLILRRNGRS